MKMRENQTRGPGEAEEGPFKCAARSGAEWCTNKANQKRGTGEG